MFLGGETFTPGDMLLQIFGSPCFLPKQVGQPGNSDCQLFGGHHNRIDRYIFAAQFAFVEGDAAFGEREQRMILATADVAARPNASTALTDDNIPCERMLTAKFLHAKSTPCRIATVA